MIAPSRLDQIRLGASFILYGIIALMVAAAPSEIRAMFAERMYQIFKEAI